MSVVDLVLIVLAGLPGAGKSTVADALGRARGWPVLSVDPVEAALLHSGIDSAQPTGLAAYVAVEALARCRGALHLDPLRSDGGLAAIRKLVS